MIDLRYALSNKIFKYYINLPYEEHSNLNPGIVIRAAQNDVGSTFALILSYIALIREILILIAIFLLLIFTDPVISIFTLIVLGVPVMLFIIFIEKL